MPVLRRQRRRTRLARQAARGLLALCAPAALACNATDPIVVFKKKELEFTYQAPGVAAPSGEVQSETEDEELQPVTVEPKLIARRRDSPFRRSLAALTAPSTHLLKAEFSDEITERAVGYPSITVSTIPKRPTGALTGSEFIAETEGYSFDEREDAIYQEIHRGNVPSFLRELRPVLLKARDGIGGYSKSVIWVMPDYLAIGSDDDFIRIPMNLYTATRLANELGFVLPTQKMVDAIYEQAVVKARPQPLPAGKEMTTNTYYARHQEMVQQALGNYQPGLLISGHKKDVVISRKVHEKPGSIVIYGWHRPSGIPIQPLSVAHNAHYADYSHGIRFVLRLTQVNGMQETIDHALASPDTARLFSYGGRFDDFRQLMNNNVRPLARAADVPSL